MSGPSRRVIISRPAGRDLQDVLSFTQERWGGIQRERYRRLLVDGFDRLALFPGVGRVRAERGEGVRSHRVGEHEVYYEVVGIECAYSA